jgi:hypothetical protein
MYSTILMAHSWVRWAVVLAGVYALVRALAGWTSRRGWSRGDERAGLLFTIALDLQLLLGIWLYAVSPFTTEAFEGFGAAMRLPALRFWAAEHPAAMLIGIVLAHVGRVRIRKGVDAVARHRTATIFFGLALAIILFSIPWPGTRNGRSLFFW